MKKITVDVLFAIYFIHCFANVSRITSTSLTAPLIKHLTITNTQMVLRDANIAQVPYMAFDITPVALPPCLDKTSSLPPI